MLAVQGFGFWVWIVIAVESCGWGVALLFLSDEDVIMKLCTGCPSFAIHGYLGWVPTYHGYLG